MSLPLRSATQPTPGKAISLPHELQNVFRSEQYHFEQPYFQITQEGYKIVSKDQTEKFSAVRPRSLFKNLIANGVGIGAFFVGFGIAMGILGFLAAKVSGGTTNPILSLVVSVFAFVAGMSAYLFARRSISPKRRLTVTDSANKTLLMVEPTSGFFLINHEYALHDHTGKALAFFRKNVFESLFRTHWHCHTASGNYLYSAVEDSLFLAILRRYLNLGRLIPLHFIFAKKGGKPFGQFIRKYSIKDKYKLNYSSSTIDGWLMVASALLLDTGEER